MGQNSDGEFELRAARFGGVRGKQTVPRAETQGYARACQIIKGRNAECHVDPKYVTNNLGKASMECGGNSDLWSQIQDADGRRLHQNVTAPWIKAHQEKDGYCRGTAPIAIYANEAADTLADLAADWIKTPHVDVVRYRILDGVATKVLSRIAAIEQVMLTEFCGRMEMIARSLEPSEQISTDPSTGRGFNQQLTRGDRAEIKILTGLAELGHHLVPASRRLRCLRCQRVAARSMRAWQRVGECHGWLVARFGTLGLAPDPFDDCRNLANPRCADLAREARDSFFREAGAGLEKACVDRPRNNYTNELSFELPDAESTRATPIRPEMEQGARVSSLDDPEGLEETGVADDPGINDDEPFELPVEDREMDHLSASLDVGRPGIRVRIKHKTRTRASDARADAYGPTAARAADKAKNITRKDAERKTISKFVKLGQDESAAGAIHMAKQNGVFHESLRHALVRRIDGRFGRSHMLASYKGLIFCWRCAAYTTGLSCRLLAHACRRRVDERGSILKSVAAKRKPFFLRRWPDEGDDDLVASEQQGLVVAPRANVEDAGKRCQPTQHQTAPESSGNERFEAIRRRIRERENGQMSTDP